MKKFRVFLNLICIIVALCSIMTIISLAETGNENVTQDVETTISQTEKTTEKTTEDVTDESTTNQSTTVADETTTTTQSVDETTTTTTEKTTEDDYYNNYDDDDDDDDDVGGTKATRGTSAQSRSKTAKRTTVAKNINDYGAKYRPLKWTCYVLAGASLIALVVINVNYVRNGDSDEDKKKKHSTNNDVRK